MPNAHSVAVPLISCCSLWALLCSLLPGCTHPTAGIVSLVVSFLSPSLNKICADIPRERVHRTASATVMPL
jgi:hypothetical protein